MARAEGVPDVELGDHREVAEPVVLQGLPECPRSVRRYVPADDGDVLELTATALVRLVPCHLLGRLGMALGIAHDRVAGDAHRGQVPASCPGPRGRPGKIEPRRGTAAMSSLKSEHALAVDLVVEHGVAGRPLLHELGEHAGVVGVEPLLRQQAEHLLAHRASLPERDDLLLVAVEAGLRHPVPGLRPRVEDLAGPRACGRSARDRSARPSARVLSRRRSARPLRCRRSCFRTGGGRRGPASPAPSSDRVVLVEGREQLGSLGRDRRRRVEALTSQTPCSFVHASASHRDLEAGRLEEYRTIDRSRSPRRGLERMRIIPPPHPGHACPTPSRWNGNRDTLRTAPSRVASSRTCASPASPSVIPGMIGKRNQMQSWTWASDSQVVESHLLKRHTDEFLVEATPPAA